MKDNDIKTQLKKALKVIFEFSYDELYKEYSSANPLSDEIEFINYLIKNQKQHTDVIESKTDFFFNNEITTEEEYENIIKRDEFWFFKQYSTYLKDKLSKLNKLPPQQTEKLKLEQETPKTFDELFYNIELVQPSIDILKEIDPPLIDTDYNYIGKLKGIICVWIDELQRQGIVKSNYPEERKLFASLIPTKIKRFSIDESMFGKHQSKAENNYRTDIKTKVSNIKLSQNSQ